ncbi:MAG: class GN sortase [Sphingobium sp.]
MTGIFPLAPVKTEGRTSWRALFRAAAALCMVVGIVMAGRGALIPVKAQVAQILLTRAFAQSLAHGHPVRPWPWADMAPTARLSVPRLGVREVVLSGGSGQAMAFGPTELRTAGRQGDSGDALTLLAAHRDTHFTFIRDLRKGDVVVLQRVKGPARRYRVTAFQTVRWDRFAVPQGHPRRLLALATCYPFDAVEQGPWRRIVWAEAIA